MRARPAGFQYTAVTSFTDDITDCNIPKAREPTPIFKNSLLYLRCENARNGIHKIKVRQSLRRNILEVAVNFIKNIYKNVLRMFPVV